jgi:hypothetical protein
MRNLLLIMTLLSFNSLSAQQWGLYTFYAPKNTATAYLVDTSDNPVTFKTWTFNSQKRNGYSSYLLPGDTVFRSYTVSNSTFSGGGIHGGVQKVSWNGTVTWDYVHSSTTYCLHHDIHPMPNGNVLLISYELKTQAQVTAAGCTTNLSSGMWSEKIIEVKPTGPTTGEIVWEWHLWDHLCQNVDAAKPNYVASVSANPHRMNINYKATKDWWHMNGIDYNPELDQIIISSHYMNEIYIIDHSTTTAEAATSSGGNSGKGGDFLYRWGNPAAYGMSGTANFNVIHDAHWIPSDNPNYAGYLCAYNNKGGTGGKTSIDIWAAPFDGQSYSMTPGQVITPATLDYKYNTSFTATNEGNSQQLPNGNMLVNNPNGVIYEVSPAGAVLWQKTASTSHAYRFSKCYVRAPRATITANPSTCIGSPITIDAVASSITESNPVFSYEWSNGETGRNFTFTPETLGVQTFTVTVTDESVGCIATATVSISVESAPETPVITEEEGTLTSTEAPLYQWYRDNEAISGATSQTLTLTQSGHYFVEIQSENGCSARSETYFYTGVGVENNVGTNGIQIYPNPTTGVVSIENELFRQTEFSVTVYDLAGMELKHFICPTAIDLSAYINGVYLLSVETGGKKTNHKIVLIK